MGKIAKALNLIKYTHSLMEAEGQSSEPMHRMICTIMGNYGRHMAFVMDPPFCTAYPLHFADTDDSCSDDIQEPAESSGLLHRRLSNGAISCSCGTAHSVST